MGSEMCIRDRLLGVLAELLGVLAELLGVLADRLAELLGGVSISLFKLSGISAYLFNFLGVDISARLYGGRTLCQFVVPCSHLSNLPSES